LHSSDGIVSYVNKQVSPAFFKESNIDREIARLSIQFNSSPRIYEAPDRPGLPKAIIATWGGIELQPLARNDLDLLAQGQNPHAGIMVDFLGDFARSAQAGLPVYGLDGSSGYVWIASFNEAGEGKLRFFAADPSQMERSAPPVARSAPPVARSAPTVAARPPPEGGRPQGGHYRHVHYGHGPRSRSFTPCQAENAAEPHKVEGFLPWPPPRGSDEGDFTDFVRGRLHDTTKGAISLEDVDRFLREELQRVGRSTFAYFSNPPRNGYAVVVRMERIDNTGHLVTISKDAAESANFIYHSVYEFFKKLVTLPEGRFRLLVFFVSNDPDLGDVPLDVEKRKPASLA
jgi:hypothetical protein